MGINHFDLIAAAMIFLIGLKGLYNGTIRELSGLIGVTLGILIGSWLAPSFGAWISDHFFAFDSPSAMSMIAFLLLLFVTWAFCIFLGILIIKHFNPTIRSLIDRPIGFLFASMKAFIIVAVIVYTLSTIEFVQKNIQPYIKQSHLYPLFIDVGESLMHLPALNKARNA